MCCYPYLALYIDICSLSEEDLSCLCVSICSCQCESCGTNLTRGEGGGERCDGRREDMIVSEHFRGIQYYVLYKH